MARQYDTCPPTPIGRAQLAARTAVWSRGGEHGAGVNRLGDAISKIIEEAVIEAVVSGELQPLDESYPIFTAEGFRWLRALSPPERKRMASQVAAAIASDSPAAVARMLDAWRFTAGCVRDPLDGHGKPFDPETWSPSGDRLPGTEDYGGALDDPPGDEPY